MPHAVACRVLPFWKCTKHATSSAMPLINQRGNPVGALNEASIVGAGDGQRRSKASQGHGCTCRCKNQGWNEAPACRCQCRIHGWVLCTYHAVRRLHALPACHDDDLHCCDLTSCRPCFRRVASASDTVQPANRKLQRRGKGSLTCPTTRECSICLILILQVSTELRCGASELA